MEFLNNIVGFLHQVRDDFISLATPAQGNDLATPLVHKYGLCERHSDHIWAEPFNVVSNIAFFVVAMIIFRLYYYNKEIRAKSIPDIHTLVMLIFCIGVGSTTFHMTPSYYTELMDMLFIVCFIVIYFISCMKRIIDLRPFSIFIIILGFAGSTYSLVVQFPNAMNDSIAYLSTMISLILIATYLNLRKRPAARAFLAASLLGVMSISFRIVDNELCDILPMGTHFLWHLFNSALIYTLMLQLLRNVNRRARMLRMAAEAGV